MPMMIANPFFYKRPRKITTDRVLSSKPPKCTRQPPKNPPRNKKADKHTYSKKGREGPSLYFFMGHERSLRCSLALISPFPSRFLFSFYFCLPLFFSNHLFSLFSTHLYILFVFCLPKQLNVWTLHLACWQNFRFVFRHNLLWSSPQTLGAVRNKPPIPDVWTVFFMSFYFSVLYIPN